MPGPRLARGLVGRAAECDRLLGVVERVARSGRGAVAIISGPPGIGKSTLARWLVAEASERGFGALAASSNPLNRDLPYGPFVESLGRCLRELAPSDRDDLVAGLPWLGGLLPGLDLGEAQMSADAGLGKTQLFESVLRLVDRLSRRAPLVLVIDDAQWCDPASLELVAYLSRDLAGLPVLLAVAYRAAPDDAAALGALVGALRRSGLALDVELGPLGDEDLAELVEELLGGPASPALCRLVADRSRGVPLFARELVGAIRGHGGLHRSPDGWTVDPEAALPLPPVVREAILDRLRLLSRADRALVELVAVAGGDVPPAVVADVVGADVVGADVVGDAGPGEGEVIAGLARLVEMGLLAESEHPRARIGFDHPLVLEVVHDQVPVHLRRAHHRRLAEAWERQDPTDLDRRAFHQLRALPDVDPGATLDLLEAAAVAASARHAYEEAVNHLTAAVALARTACPAARSDLLRQLGIAHLRTGDRRSGVAAWEEAIDDPTHSDGPGARLRIHCLIADACADWGDLATAGRHIRAGLDLAGGGRHPGPELELRRAACHVAYQRAGLDEVDRAAADLMTAAEAVDGAEAAAAVAEARGVPRLLRGEYDAAARLMAPGLGDGDGADPRLEVRRHSLPAMAAAARGDLAALRELNRIALAAARRIGIPQAAYRSYLLVFVEAFYAADWSRAEEVVREAERLAETFDHPRILAVAPTVGAVLAGFRGDFAGADRCLARLEGAAGRGALPDEQGSRLHRMVGAIVDLERGDPAAAWSRLEALEPDYVGDLLPGWTLLSRAEALARTGQTEASLHAARRLAVLGPAGSHPDAMARRIRSLAEAASGRPGRAAELARSAAGILAGLGMPFEAARVGVEAVELAMAAGVVPGFDAGAVARWRSTFVDVGAASYATRAARLLGRGAGAEDPRPADSGLTPRQMLTPRQTEVAEAVAEGLSNAEIAEKLFVSVRTVESHLDHIYTRLGIGSRVSLASYVFEARARSRPIT